ncbi:hypothetical protein FQN54_009160 [Arachnomyces sp. PD_36]|nr:hypothetical protein FQN54_009160 [Arachnomyces sp. PD_36]
MAPNTPIVQLLEKADYRKQHLVKLPDSLPAPPLGESQVRIRSSIISLTVNNITYAKLGDALGWWNVWLPPPSLPEPYTDTSKYGRVSAWGYCTVIDSTISSLPVGSKLYGYLPIATLPEVLDLQESADAPGYYTENSPHRQHLFPIYNRYIKPPLAGLTPDGNEQSMAFESIMHISFETEFNLNRHVFSWDPARPFIQPGLGMPNNPEWTAENADLKDAVVVILAASGKNALAFAYNLKHNRPSAHKPSKVIAVGSEPSLPFLTSTNLHDNAFPYSFINGSNPNLKSDLGITSPSTKIAILNFGARGDSATEWAGALANLTTTKLTLVAIGSDPAVTEPSVLAARMAKNAEQGWVRMNASGTKELSMKMLGEKGYFEQLGKEWDGFMKDRETLGLEIELGDGMDGVGKGWDRLTEGRVESKTGLVFKL